MHRDRFALVKDGLTRSIRNRLLRPMSQAQFARWLTTKEFMIRNDEALEGIERASADDVAAYLPTMLRAVQVEVLAHGNLGRADVSGAGGIADAVRSALARHGCAGIPPERRFVERCLHLPEGRRALVVERGNNPDERNSVLELYYQLRGQDLEGRCLLALFEQCIDEACFNTLRTKQQLGYSVDSGMRLTHGMLGFAVRIQSASHDPNALEERAAAFVDGFVGALGGMAAAEFEKHKRALIAVKLTKPNNLVEEAMEYWEPIYEGTYGFRLRQQEAERVRGVGLEELVAFATRHFAPQRARRLSVLVFGSAHATPEAIGAACAPREGTVLLSDPREDAAAARARLDAFKGGLEVLRAPCEEGGCRV